MQSYVLNFRLGNPTTNMYNSSYIFYIATAFLSPITSSTDGARTTLLPLPPPPLLAGAAGASVGATGSSLALPKPNKFFKNPNMPSPPLLALLPPPPAAEEEEEVVVVVEVVEVVVEVDRCALPNCSVNKKHRSKSSLPTLLVDFLKA